MATQTIEQRAAILPRAKRLVPGRGRKHEYDRARGMPYWLILPALVFYVAFVLIPIVETFRQSFFQWDGLGPQIGVGWGNFKAIFSDPQTLHSFVVSAVMVGFTCALPVCVALGLTGVIVRTKVRGLSFLRFVFFLPYTVALAVVAIAWRWMYASNGLVNTIVGAIFGKGAVDPYLGSFGLALPATGIIVFWATFGFVTVLLLSGAQHIPRELYEAARVDGAGVFREFFAITVPGVKRELRVALIMTFIMAMRTFDIPLITTNGGPGYATTTPILTMYQDVFINGEIGQGAAIAVLVSLITLLGVLVINLLIRTDD